MRTALKLSTKERRVYNFECHITIDAPSTTELRQLVEIYGWTFSCIAGDPVLGQKEFCYATNHFDDKQVAVDMALDRASYIRARGYAVVRVKVEEIVFDTRRPS